MLNWIIDFSLRHRLLVILGVAGAGGGRRRCRCAISTSTPSPTPRRCRCRSTRSRRRSGPEEVEQQITFPIEQAIGGLPGLESMRSVSKFGFSQVVVTFEDGTDIYFARQLINERLADRRTGRRHRAGPKMGPVATGLGEVFHYVVTGAGNDVTELRTIHDWVIKPKLRTVPGVAEINSWGGYEKQYQVRIDPEPADQVRPDVRRGRRGGRRKQPQRRRRQRPRRHAVGAGAGPGPHRPTSTQIKGIVITAKDGVPIRVGDVADVAIGSEIRRGAVTADGKGEVVLGLGFMLMGENTHEVTWAMKDRLDEIKATLPPNVDVAAGLRPHRAGRSRHRHGEEQPVRGRAAGHRRAVRLPGQSAGGADRGRWRFRCRCCSPSAGMLRFGIAASLLSLGAIDFGMIVDSSVVMVENCVRHIAHGDNRRRPHDRRRPRRGRRGPQADDVRRADHHDRLPADPHAGRDRRQAVPADGADGHLRPDRLDDPVADADAGAGQPAAAAADRGARAAADADRPSHPRPDPAVLDASQDAGRSASPPACCSSRSA